MASTTSSSSCFILIVGLFIHLSFFVIISADQTHEIGMPISGHYYVQDDDSNPYTTNLCYTDSDCEKLFGCFVSENAICVGSTDGNVCSCFPKQLD